MEKSMNALTRRRLFRLLAAAMASGLTGSTASALAKAASVGPYRYSSLVRNTVRDALIIDMLALVKIDFRPEYPAAELSEKDAREFRESGVTAIHHAIGLGDSNTKEEALEFFAAWQGFVGRNTGVFLAVGEIDDIERAKREGKCAVIMGLQNSSHFDAPDDVDRFYRLGQRCSQLTYNSQNLIGSGSTERIDGGITDFGAAIIERMNKVGMLVDVSHCGDRTTLDAIEMSKGPIAITHSNCRALNNHPRLKTDEAIRALAAKGGVFGVTGVRQFVRGSEPTNIGHLVDHIDHAVRLVGIDHVGIGSDADLNGYDDMPANQRQELRDSYKGSYAFRDLLDTDRFDSPTKYFDLVEELLRRGYSPDNAKLILGGNFRRLLSTVWKRQERVK